MHKNSRESMQPYRSLSAEEKLMNWGKTVNSKWIEKNRWKNRGGAGSCSTVTSACVNNQQSWFRVWVAWQQGWGLRAVPQKTEHICSDLYFSQRQIVEQKRGRIAVWWAGLSLRGCFCAAKDGRKLVKTKSEHAHKRVSCNDVAIET